MQLSVNITNNSKLYHNSASMTAKKHDANFLTTRKFSVCCSGQLCKKKCLIIDTKIKIGITLFYSLALS